MFTRRPTPRDLAFSKLSNLLEEYINTNANFRKAAIELLDTHTQAILDIHATIRELRQTITDLTNKENPT